MSPTLSRIWPAFTLPTWRRLHFNAPPHIRRSPLVAMVPAAPVAGCADGYRRETCCLLLWGWGERGHVAVEVGDYVVSSEGTLRMPGNLAQPSR
jgi:hypothetical protein